MKKYYCVSTTIFDNGNILSSICSSKFAEERPKSTMEVSTKEDRYYDWFSSIDDAEEFIEITKR